MSKTIRIAEYFGNACLDKKKAMVFLNNEVIPTLESENSITFDFAGIRSMNSGFSFVLFSNLIMQKGPEAVESINFSNCVPGVRFFITTALELGLKMVKDHPVSVTKADGSF